MTVTLEVEEGVSIAEGWVVFNWVSQLVINTFHEADTSSRIVAWKESQFSLWLLINLNES